MENDMNFREMMIDNGNTDHYVNMILGALGASEDSEIKSDYSVFDNGDSIEELWDIDDVEGEVTTLLTIDNLNLRYDKPSDNGFKGMSIGHCRLISYNGKLIWMEQNASPFLIYYVA